MDKTNKEIDIYHATPEKALEYVKEKGIFAGFMFEIPGEGIIVFKTHKFERPGMLEWNLEDLEEVWKKVGNYAFKEFKKNQISDKKRFQVFKRDHFTCQYCGRSAKDGAILEIDHIIPKSKGGTDDIDNLITACRECNRGKGKESLNE